MVVQMNKTAPSRFVTEMSERERREDDLRRRVTKKFTEPGATEAPSELFAGRYRKVRMLGDGGMGIVYLMEDVELGDELVAVKMLAPHLAKNEDALNLIAREAKNALKLHHPHIVCVRHYAKCDQTPYIVMDYISGMTIRQQLRDGGAIPEPMTVKLLEPIADALDYAHRATINRPSVLHRDIKPDNIIFQCYDDGTLYPVILDFGISKTVEEIHDSGKVSTHTRFRRTPGYAAPEKLLDAQCPSTIAQDVFSFAVTAYECLTGKLPFGSEEDGRARERMRNGDFERIKIDSPFARAVERGLSYSPDDRPKSCAEFFVQPKCAEPSIQEQGPTPKSDDNAQERPDSSPQTKQESVASRSPVQTNDSAHGVVVPPHTPEFVPKTSALTSLCSDYRVMLAESATLHREDEDVAEMLRNIQAQLRDALEAEDDQVDSFLLVYLFNTVSTMRRQFSKAHRGMAFFMEHRRRNVELRIVGAEELPWSAAMKKSIRV